MSLAPAIDAALVQLRAGDIDGALSGLQALQPDAGAARQAALGMAYLAAGDWPASLAALRLAVAAGDVSPPTLLNLALAEDRAGDAERGRAGMIALRERLAGWDEPGLRLAESFRREGLHEPAEAAYRRVLDSHPGRTEALIGLAAVLLDRAEPGRIEAAREAQLILLRCCGQSPSSAEAWDALGIALTRTGDMGQAEAAFAKAQANAPDDMAIALRRMEASVAFGSSASELARLELACLEDPLNTALLTARGALLSLLGRHKDALEILGVAVLLDPQAALPAAALAHAWLGSHQVHEAIQALRKAIALAPGDVSLRNNLAASLVRVHRYREAIAELDALIAEAGEQPGFLCNLTNALVSVGQHEAALQTARRVVTLEPRSHLAWRTMYNVLAYHPGVTASHLLEAAQLAGDAIVRTKPPRFRNARDPHRRIRVGLLSTMLKTHPVGWLTVAGFENLDPAAFEIVCLAQAESNDPLERRFRSVASQWHVIETADPATRIATIRALELDIVIDLGGYGDRGLMPLCADRLAPVQIKWVGAQSHSSGLAEMDWFITDRWETPAGSSGRYAERLLELPDGYVCYSPPAYAPSVGPLPAQQNGYVTYGCFNNLAKINAQVIAAWTRILGRVAGSRLILKSHQLADRDTADHILGQFCRHGIDPGRIELRGGSSHRDLLQQYADIDIVLDPFPYSGGLTTCEALWMGVPTVTVPGETFASRHSASHMSNVGMADWVAADLAAYEELAVALVSDLARLSLTRSTLRSKMRESPLCDAPRFGAHLGQALRHAWSEWCAADGPGTPDDIALSPAASVA